MPEKKIETKEKICPFNPTLKCEDCRLFIKASAKGPRCIFEEILWSLQGIDLFGGK